MSRAHWRAALIAVGVVILVSVLLYVLIEAGTPPDTYDGSD